MHAAATSASIAISISIATALLAGLFSVWVAMRSRKPAAINRDTVVSILFGIALLLIGLTMVASTLIAVSGMAYVGLLKAALLLTAAFAAMGMACGLMRGLRSGRAIKPQST
jgi:hypothetical protein